MSEGRVRNIFLLPSGKPGPEAEGVTLDTIVTNDVNHSEYPRAFVFVPGFQGDYQGRAGRYIEQAEKHGIRGVAFNPIMHGTNANRVLTQGVLAENTRRAVLYLLQEDSHDRVGLVGSSTGCLGVFQHAVQYPSQTKLVVAISPFVNADGVNWKNVVSKDKGELENQIKYRKDHNRYPYVNFKVTKAYRNRKQLVVSPIEQYEEAKKWDALALARKLTVPTLILAGKRDERINFESIQELYDAIPQDTPKLLIPYDTGHALTNRDDLVLKAIFGWCDQHWPVQ